jgi:hypothetical protein
MKTRAVVVIPALVLAAALFALPSGGATTTKPATIPFGAASIIVEKNATAGDAGLQFFLDSDDAWRSIVVRSPDGEKALDFHVRGHLKSFGLTELFSESNEPPFDELPLREFLARFPAGVYRFSGTTIEGKQLAGTARLNHRIPRAPKDLSPRDGERVSRNRALIGWKPAQQATGVHIDHYQVIVERDEPLRTFQVDLPATADHVAIPRTFLESGAEYKVEVLAVERGGNQTITESDFVTR